MNIVRRWGLAVVFFAIVIAAQPVLHTHRASGDEVAPPCAVCITAHAQVLTTAPQIHPHLAVVSEASSNPQRTTVAAAALALPARAPPAD